MRRFATLLLTAVVGAFTLLPVFGSALGSTAYAVDAKQEICAGLGGTGKCTVRGQPSISATIRRIINVLSMIAGVAAVIMIIVGGFRYITSNGDSGTISAARRTVMYALVGLVVVALSQMLVWFVLDRVL